MNELSFMFLLILGLLVIGVPIGVSLGLGVVGALWWADESMMFFTQKLFNNFDSFPLLAIPFFVLSGDIMARGTLADTLLNFCRAMLGHRKAGMAYITIITCLFYGALCGSAAATTAAVGATMIPAMEREGYPKPFATAVSTSSGALGIIIPPSIPMILYGAFGGVSVADLFIGGIIPGCFIGLMLMVTAGYICHRHNYDTVLPKASLAERWASFKKAGWALGVPVIILGGIYGGIATPTEAGVMAVVYALLVETFINRSMTWKLCAKIMVDSANTVGLIMLVLVTANALGNIMMLANIQEALLSSMQALTSSKHVLLAILIVFLFFLGMVVEVSAIILIFAPLLVPVVTTYGIDPVHFGIVFVVSMCLGGLTPPVGVNLFIGCSISNLSIVRLTHAVLPFIAAIIAGCFILAYVPAFTLCLL
ncbi:MAG: TRAP transporter large permease [Desulfovibrionaceae bacterium]|nr:TRAP transporter large permease [Desulfovibrionaceae bacterium]